MAFARWTVGIAVFAALLLLSLQNSDLVTVRFYQWFSWQAPLIILLLIAFATGLLAGLLAGLIRVGRLKRQLSRLRKEQRRGPATQPQHPVDDG
jgi:lipopolysaccharide assembly protein A